jgi:O-antigen/teichoic acid export membrane protein
MEFRKILSDSLFSGLRTILFVVRRVAVIPVITAVIGAGGYGTWVATIGLVNLFAAFGRLHMHGALIKYTGTVDDEQLLVDTLSLSIVGGIITVGLFFLIENTVGILGGRSPPGLVPGTAMLIFLYVLFGILVNTNRARGKVKRFEALRIVWMAGESAIILPVVFLTESLVPALWGLVSFNALVVVVLAFRYLPRKPSVPSYERLKTYLGYSLPVMPKEVSDVSLSRIDKILLLSLVSPAAAGVYSAVYTVTSVFRVGLETISVTLYPSVTSAWEDGDFDDLRTLYENLALGFGALSIPAAIGITILAPDVLVLIATELMARRGAAVVPILVVGALARGAFEPLTYLLLASERTKSLGAIMTVAAVTNGLLNFLLIPSFGVAGAAATTVVAHGFMLTTAGVLTNRLLPFSIPLRQLFKSSLAASVMGASLVTLPFEPSPITRLVAYPLAGAIIYATVLYLIGGFHRSDVRKVREFLLSGA